MKQNISRAEADLTWFFTFAQGELGLSSNHATMVALIEGGPTGAKAASSDGAEAKMEDALDAAKRYRVIAGRISSIKAPAQRTLQRAFTLVRLPPQLERRGARLCVVACHQPVVVRRLGKAWSLRRAFELLLRAESDADLTIVRVSAWAGAEDQVRDAVRAYVEVEQ
jgi:hypothetical protein